MTRPRPFANLSVRTVRRVIIAAIVLPLLWYVISPYFISQTVNESLPAVPEASGQGGSAPRLLATGQFGMVDPLHKGEGTASIVTLADGQRVLRFEDFTVTNGPDLFVYLSGHPEPRNGGQVHENGVELGRLKGNVGSQNYTLPADLDLSKVKSVVIYCKQFSFVFSTATLLPGA
jgi:hypothetical protein